MGLVLWFKKQVMITPQTIVIIGTGQRGRGIAEGLSRGHDRVLLCDHDFNNALSVAQSLKENHPGFEVEAIPCFFDATWEADIIIVDLACTEQQELAEKIKTVANQKVVVTTSKSDHLAALLPQSRVVQAFDDINLDSFRSMEEGEKINCLVIGQHEEAVQTVADLVKTVGFLPEFHPTVGKEKKAIIPSTQE